jgi:hypothetical protein
VQITLKKSEGYAASVYYKLQLKTPTAFHFVFRDCQKSIINEYFRKETEFKLDLEMNNGTYHHGADEHLNKYLLPLLLLLTAAMLYFSNRPSFG